jgi:hypothetical protein
MFSWHRTSSQPQPLSIIGNQPDALPQRTPRLQSLHGFVFLNEISNSNHFLCRGVAESFSDAVVHPAPHVFYGSLENTFSWFKDKQHLHEYISAQDGFSQNRIVFASNILHGFFYGLLTNRGGILFADSENIEYARFRRSITWDDWIEATKEFIAMLSFSKGKKQEYQKQTESLAKHMQNLRLHIPAGVPPQISQSDLQHRFGLFATDIWLQWSRFTNNSLPMQNLSHVLNPTNYTTTSSDAFPNSYSFRPSEIPLLFSETFFRCASNISELNSQSIRFGIKSFESILRCNDGLLFRTRHELVAPIFIREKLAERIIDGCVELAKKNMHATTSEHTLGIRVVVEPSWVESFEIVPLSIQVEQARSNSLFSLSNRTKSAQDVAFSLSTERIGTVSAAQPPLELLRFAAMHHPICLLRTPWEADFSKFSTKHLRYMETQNDHDYFLVQLEKNSPLLWARSAVSLRSTVVNERQMTCVGICAAPIDGATIP